MANPYKSQIKGAQHLEILTNAHKSALFLYISCIPLQFHIKPFQNPYKSSPVLIDNITSVFLSPAFQAFQVYTLPLLLPRRRGHRMVAYFITTKKARRTKMQ